MVGVRRLGQAQQPLDHQLDLRLLGVAPDLPLKSFKPFFSVMWLGFGINAISGLFLLIAYPTRAFTNPVFYVKLLLIAFAVVVMQRMKNRLFGDVALSESDIMVRGRAMATLSLVLWIGAITSGRLLAYTFIYRMYGER